MWYFIDWQTTLECVLITLVFASLLTLVLYKPLTILQSLGYSNRKFFAWVHRKNNMYNSRCSLLAFFCLLTCAVISLCFSFLSKISYRWPSVIGLMAYVIFFVFYIYVESRNSFRGHASLTPRFIRLIAAVWLVFALLLYITTATLTFIAYVWENEVFYYLKYCVLALFPLLALYILALANIIARLWEKPIKASFVKKAKRKLSKSDLIVVGITGSYGKTGTKNILNAMLAKKYQVVATPASYNTPMGISKTVNENDLPNGGVFIAEMGARHEGDIAELCSICPPDYSLITGICPQHLESFKSLENIVKTKGEIIEATKHKTFVAADAYDYFKDREKAVCVTCASNVSADCTGTAFTLTFGNEKASVKTKLLGAHNAANIALCASLAHEMGVPLKDIAEAISELDFTEHRLQLLKSNGVNILDDGYNSNVVGARAALEVLRSFEGRKICVTPGLVELGIIEEGENELLGRELAGLDRVILVGETLVLPVQQGYLAAGGDASRLTVVTSLKRAQDIIAQEVEKGDNILFLNDLPEQYT